jgi:hypothetical protein
MNNRRRERILTKLAAEKAPSEGTNTVLRILGSRKLGFGDVKANKQTAKTVPGQEVLHSGGKWAQQALAQQEARIGIRPSLPTPGVAPMAKTARTKEVSRRTGGALWEKAKSVLGFTKKAPNKKPMSQLQKKEIALGLRSPSGAPVRVTTGNTRRYARVNSLNY